MLYRDSAQSSKTGTVMQARDNGVLKERERTVPVDGYLEDFVHLFISTSVFPDLPKSDMRFYLKIPNPNFFISVTDLGFVFLSHIYIGRVAMSPPICPALEPLLLSPILECPLYTQYYLSSLFYCLSSNNIYSPRNQEHNGLFFSLPSNLTKP